MAFTPKDNSGALFHNKKKGSDNAPDYSGECVIGGVGFQIAGWKNTSAKGTSYLSLKFQLDQKVTDDNEARAKLKVREDESDIPF